ncbi:hypothetical protein OSTOST_10789, partial [Ostertagia ostertagi]
CSSSSADRARLRDGAPVASVRVFSGFTFYDEYSRQVLQRGHGYTQMWLPSPTRNPVAHAKIVQEQRRRFRSITDEASSHVRNALRNIPSKATSTIRSHVSSSVYEDRKTDFAGRSLSDVVRVLEPSNVV